MLGLAALILLSAPTPAAARDDIDPIVARAAAEIQAGIQPSRDQIGSPGCEPNAGP